MTRGDWHRCYGRHCWCKIEFWSDEDYRLNGMEPPQPTVTRIGSNSVNVHRTYPPEVPDSGADSAQV